VTVDYSPIDRGLTLIIIGGECALGFSGANTMLINRSRRSAQKSLHYNFRKISKRAMKEDEVPPKEELAGSFSSFGTYRDTRASLGE